MLALASIGALVFFSLPRAEPIINDQPLTFWLNQLPTANLEYASPECQRALAAMDDRCIPVLIHKLSWKPSPILRHLGLRWFDFALDLEPQDQRAQAILVLARFGPRASNAVPSLSRLNQLSYSEDETGSPLRGAAIAALIMIRHDSAEACARKSLELSEPKKDDYQFAILSLGTNAVSCVSTFIIAIETATNEDVKCQAALSLGYIHSSPELSLPILVSMLSETNVQSRRSAAYALSLFREAAKPAWNDLVKHSDDPDQGVRHSTVKALYYIDPNAAAQLGIEIPGASEYF